MTRRRAAAAALLVAAALIIWLQLTGYTYDGTFGRIDWSAFPSHVPSTP